MLNFPSGPFAGLVILWADTSVLPCHQVMLMAGGLKPNTRHTSSGTLVPCSSSTDGGERINEAKKKYKKITVLLFIHFFYYAFIIIVFI